MALLVSVDSPHGELDVVTTHLSWRPDGRGGHRRVDYIVCPTKVRVRSSEIILAQPGTEYPSEHFGLLAELQWKAA